MPHHKAIVRLKAASQNQHVQEPPEQEQWADQVNVVDGFNVSPRARRFLLDHGSRVPPMPESAVRRLAQAVSVDGQPVPVAAELISAMVDFEARYGGLSYSIGPGNPMEYGLDGQPYGYWTELGWAFAGILDGDWTLTMDVLVDGRTSIAPGMAPRRLIDRSIDQRLEKHALLAHVRGWPHRTATVNVEPGVVPQLSAESLPAAAPEATGPADLWWCDKTTAAQLALHTWWHGETDTWELRTFAQHPGDLPPMAMEINDPIERAQDVWCSLCAHYVRAGTACIPERR